MSTTKNRILNKALELFNEKGISSISSKAIAEALGISYGNLCYHFPRKDDIVLELYLNMQEEVDGEFKLMHEEVMNFDFVLDRLKVLFSVMYKYKFIYLGITKVIRHFDHIKQHAIEQDREHKRILSDLSDFLINNGYMNPFQSEKQKDMLIRSLLLVSHSWISDAEVFYDGDENDKIEYYMRLFFNLIRPSLTDKGKMGFKKVYV
ncbi:TetR/AcrR family transcriptional regulator [Marinigracilibium pacificum]|uniref:TetR/AcrR family transcriptional regulator n=1 Tax=Marinigracilibium pacificum TaxID=2729599 RepID=A0A848J2E9_9BACT|nr:TetR/AcrR family transcriptional regulator [Marinigracilibium pacificum]NMM47362.1 TetR/AcrR family transcriptional regulator [Marinigracilibium pacificum]